MLKLLIILLFAFNLSFAQEVSEVEEAVKTEEQERKERLYTYRRDLVTLESQIAKIRKKLASDIDMVSRIQEESKLAKLEKDYANRRYRYIRTITNVDLDDSDLIVKQTSFSEDIRQILDPVLQTFKKISAKPRQMQELNEQSEAVTERLRNAKKAKAELDEFLKANINDKSLLKETKKSQALVKRLIKDLEKKNSFLEDERQHIEENQQSIVTTFSSIIFDFIKTKGKNLILAMLVFALVYWGFKYGQERLINLFFFKMQKSENNEFYQWLIRPTRVLYSVCTFLIAFFMSILTLYVMNDWVLVTIILITFAALIWSSKQYFPLFFEQSKIVLNLGAVRENERLMYAGIPWKIKSLGYYCRLVNPELDGGALRINTKELLNANSRRIQDMEPWFPTRRGDWIQSNELFGQVILQTPEQVVIEQVGGEKKYITTADFYAMQPKNLSQGFSIEIHFGVDYQHQKIIFSEIIPAFKAEVEKRLLQEYPQAKQSLRRYSVEFLGAGASSLDIRVFLKINGEMASLKLAMTRSVQSYLVEVCNQNNYVIPFNQLTVHMAK